MSWYQSPKIQWLIVLGCAVIMFVDYFFAIGPITSISNIIQKWVVTMIFFTLLLGTINILRIHIQHIKNRTKEQWYFSIYLVFMFLFMVVTGLSGKIATNPMFVWVYTQVQLPISNAIYSLTAFYITAALYRAFILKRIEGTFLVISAILVMLYNIPFGGVIWPGFNNVGGWILDVPNTAVQRAIIITTVIGMISLAVRVFMGRERGVAFRGGE